jgi:hypothetical protein
MRQTAVLLGLFVTGATAFAADPQLLNMVMPDAKVLAGVNATSARISPFGQFVISKLGMLGQEPQKFIAATGFNPLQDVSEVLIASAADPTHPGGLLLARGNFNVDKIAAAASGNGAAQVQTYNAGTLIEVPVVANGQQLTTHAVAFIGNSIAIAGDLPSVKAAIDRNGTANSIDTALALKVRDLSAAGDEWLVSATSIASLLPPNAGAGASGPAAQVLPLLKNIQSFSGGVKFGDTVQVTGQAVTTDPSNAAALNAVIRLAVSLASVNTPANNPELATVLQWLQGVQVTTADAAVNVALAIPETQIETLVNSLPAHRAAAPPVLPARKRNRPNGN